VRYLNVQGIVDPVLPPPKLENVTLYPEMVIRERKFGEFSREFVVPAHLKVRLNFDVSIPHPLPLLSYPPYPVWSCPYLPLPFWTFVFL
jgi:hypothetical protein